MRGQRALAQDAEGRVTPAIPPGEANDTLTGGAGADVHIGHAGNDTIDGGDGPNILVGASGDDVLVGGDGADRLTGNRGDDRAYAGAGSDTALGGPGSDLVVGGGGGPGAAVPGSDRLRWAREFRGGSTRRFGHWSSPSG